MTENVQVVGGVRVEPASKEAVAFDLFRFILNNEPGVQRNRKYYLTLYSQCLQTTRGDDIESVSPPFE